MELVKKAETLAAQGHPIIHLSIGEPDFTAPPEVVQALIKAAKRGAEVTAFVEVKARFDEALNLHWAQEMEEAGVRTVYSGPDLKVHAKLAVVSRREDDGHRSYAYLATGNFNERTSRIYCDHGLLTADPRHTEDLDQVFLLLTGQITEPECRHLLVAPVTLRPSITELIRREASTVRRGRPAGMVLKMNSLEDEKLIRELAEAGAAGVHTNLIVRGICCLKPGVDRVSENIQVTSIVGRFLEHARAYYFRNGGDEEILMGSADLMPRNLNGRVELLFPVEDPRLRDAIRDDLLLEQLQDNTRSWRLMPDGAYERLAPAEGEKRIDTMERRLAKRGSWHIEE